MNFVEMFRNVAIRFADSAAIVDKDGSRTTTYAALDDLSSRVAGKLRSSGCVPGDFVPVRMGRVMEYWAAYIGVLKAGCAVVPVSPDYPQERLNFISADCSAPLSVTEEFFEDIDACAPICEPAGDDDPALLIYTSGSTGRPKGIVHSSRSLAAAVKRQAVLLEGIENPVSMSASSFSFVIHVLEFLMMFYVGAKVHVLSEACRRSPALIAERSRQYGANVCVITTQMLRYMQKEDFHPRRVIVASEALSRIYFPDIELYNVYGQSESCAGAGAFLVDRSYDNTPVGKGFPGVDFIVTDDDGKQLPDGQTGEICIVGEFGARYFKNPELTAATFFPLSDGRTLIRTGDTGYRQPDGNVVYVSRKDWMVKINGQRVEALGVERALKDVEGIDNAAVRAFRDENGQNYIVGYYESGADISDAAIRSSLGRTLPDYMIPRFLVRMDALPKNVNGKLDRTVLLPPDKTFFKNAYAAPGTEEEKALCLGFEQVLHCGRVGLDDNFFSLGGDSIKVLQLVGEAGIDTLSADMILSGKTPRSIAALCVEASREAVPHLETIPGTVPLTEAQKGVYLHCSSAPDSLMYNIPMMYRLPQGTDSGRYIAAVKGAALMHRALTVRICTPEGVPSMQCTGAEIEVEEKTVGSLGEECRAFVRPFDLENGPLYRFELCHSPEGDAFLFDVHHIVFDGSSAEVLISHIDALYRGESIGEEALTQFDVAAAEAALKEGPGYEAARAFFAEKLDAVEWNGSPVPDVVEHDAPRGEGRLALNSELKFSVRDLAVFTRKAGVTENTVFLTAFAYALSKMGGTKQSTFCTVNSGRHDARLAGTVGMFVKTLPMCLALDAKASMGSVLESVQQDFFSTMKHDCISFAELVRDYGVDANVTFIYQSEMETPLEELERGDCQSDIDFMIFKEGAIFRLLSHYRRNLYTESFVRNFSRMFFNIVGGILSKDSLADISLLDEEALATLDGFNRTEVPWRKDSTIVDIFRAQASKTPENTCLVCDGRSYSYREVDSLSDRLAAHILKCGIGKGSIVGVLIPRSEHMLICSLGVLKAGAAYMPLDPGYPAERLNLMMQDSGAKMLLCDPSLSSLITEEFAGPRISVEEIAALEDTSAVLPRPCPDDLFVILYTSGSTGIPKGVIFSHSNVMCTLECFARVLQMDESSRYASYASYGFDAHIPDIYSSLLNGGQLHIIPEEMRLDLAAVQEYFNRCGITHTTMTTQVGRQFALMEGHSSLHTLVVAGEKLPPIAPPEGLSLYNCYGPTEGSVATSRFLVDRLYRDVPIGKPFDNIKIYIVGPDGSRLPVGAVGELWLSGPHVTGGYLNRPEKTAEAYGENPFPHPEGYERVYRTGDVVRLLGDGNLQFVGRRDSLVKVRGFRIELTEVEEVVRRFSGVVDATVAAFDDPSGGKYLCAYVVSPEKLDPSEVAAFVSREKPYYMVPSVVMQIDAIPLNRNHKVDRRALPRPERKAADTTPPRNDSERMVFETVADVLGHREFGIFTDLYEAGLTSIGSLKLNIALGKESGKAVKISDIKQNSTVEALADFISGLEDNRLHPSAVQEDYPLMQNQTGVFLDFVKDSKSLNYNIPTLLKISDGIDEQRLREAVRAALDSHPFVKATLASDGALGVRIARNDAAEPAVEVISLPALPASAGLIRPFELIGGRLYRAEIYLTPEGKYLFLDVHHIVCDGTSMSILISDINAAYDGGKPAVERFTGFDACLEEERLLSTEKYGQGKEYFGKLLSGCNGDCLPAKCPEADGASGGRELEFCFGEASKEISAWCSEKGRTANAFFNAVFGYTLSRFLHADDVTYCTVYNGRSDSRFAECFAMLVKTLPVRCVTDFASAPADLVSSVQEQLIATMASDIVPFSELSAAYSIRPDIFFNYQGEGFLSAQIGGEAACEVPLDFSPEKAPLSFEVFLKDGVYTLKVSYSADCYCSGFVSAFASALIKAAQEFTVKGRLSEVSILADAQKAFFDEVNFTDTPIEDVPAYRFFEKFARQNPDKPAVRTSGASLSFGELDERASSIAAALADMGARPGDIVGMVLERSENIPAVEIGIMKAGCAFLPMLPSYPDERIDFCLRDASCRFVISSRDLPGSPCKVLSLEELLAYPSSEAPDVEVAMDSLVYCIYTSGSTGNPKGVMLEHCNLSNFVQVAPCGRDMQCADTVLCMASISFDMSITEIFCPLCWGKTIYIAAEDEVHNPVTLLSAMEKYGVDAIMMTPSFAWTLLSAPDSWKALRNLKLAILGAEAFQPALFDSLKALNPDMMVQNGYGPTECTQACSFKPLSEGRNITVGRPMPNMKFLVMDASGNLLPSYAVGELIICGKGVGRGYVNLPEKTAAAFFETNGARAYHSGDLVRINRDGEAEFFGRADNQVKLRGFRVELDEIENAVCDFPEVSQSKVVVRNNGGEDYLAGFFTASSAVDIDKLTAHLNSRLPYYMVPSVLVQLEKMPLTVGGKIDKKALPETSQAAGRRSGSRKAAKKSMEQRLCEIFASVLGLEEVYADDNFFELGGTSLSASKVTMMLMSENVEVEYGDIFDNPTPEALAELIRLKNSEAAPSAAHTSRLDVQTTREALKWNTMKYVGEVRRDPLGGVLLTGATGFLGIHVLRELLDLETGPICCLVRKGGYKSPEHRLKSMLFYYFEDGFDEAFGSRLSVIDADITDGALEDALKDVRFDTVINCAACVKHFADDDIIERVNVHGVENLIGICSRTGRKLIQISTTSVPGMHTRETYEKNVKLHENEIFVIDDFDNKYGISKYRAELLMFDAIEKGMKGKVIRVGNLMGRFSDGEFQINMHTNMFMNGIRGFAAMGKCPYSHMTDTMRFSPIDSTAKAVVLLSGTNDKFTAFNCDNRFSFDEMQVIDACNRNGVTIVPTEDEEYYAEYRIKLGDESMNSSLSALAAYDKADVHAVETDNRFTANVLYHLGFSWPFTDEEYLEKAINSLQTMAYFDLESADEQL